jgi:signal transduction histidine kinase
VRLQLGVRARLTLVYGAFFLLAGGVLLAFNYTQVSRGLPRDDIKFEGTISAGPPPGMEALPLQKGQFSSGTAGEGRTVVAEFNGQPASLDFIQGLPRLIRSKALHTLLVQSLLALGAVGAGSVLLGWLVAGRVLRPLHRITETARRLSESNLHERIGLDGPHDELRELGDTFDGMLARLDTAFESQRRFVANASHELRTPLAIMRAQLEVAVADPAATTDDLRSTAAVVQHVIDRSERLVDGLLLLARADGRLHTEAVDLADLVLSSGAMERAAARDLKVEVVVAPAPVHGDPALLAHVIDNLLDNAVRYNVDGGWIVVETRRQGGDAVLVVRNGGPVLPADAVEELFEPFRRFAVARTRGDKGAGLGLSIVRAVTRAHGGDVTAVALSGGGLELVVRMPALVEESVGTVRVR